MLSLPSSPLSGPPWHYWRESHPAIREMSMARGRTLALPLHFHQEDQLAFVLSGCRHFFIMDRQISLRAGEGLLMPAGTPHFSRDEPGLTGLTDNGTDGKVGEKTDGGASGNSQTFCLNLYLAPAQLSEPADCAALIQHCLGQRPARIHLAPHPALPLSLQEELTNQPILTLARQANMSREAYSRRFHRQYGLAPQAFRLLHRLNNAKAELRNGASALDAAINAGFADQSHMGRLFRRSFGTTPGRYRAEPNRG